MIKYVIFDFDGTLVDSNNIKEQTFFEVTDHLPNSKKILEKILSNPKIGDRYEIFKHFALKLNLDFGILVDDKELARTYTLLCEERISKAESIQGVEKTLKELIEMGIKLFVSSATPEGTLNNILSKRDISYLFERAFGTPNTKEKHIESVIKTYKCSSCEILYVGDSEADRMAASNRSCQFFAIGVDYSRFKTKPKIISDSVLDLPKWISNIN